MDPGGPRAPAGGFLVHVFVGWWLYFRISFEAGIASAAWFYRVAPSDQVWGRGVVAGTSLQSRKHDRLRSSLSDLMRQYSIGIEDHYAWANLVSLITSGPDEVLLDRRRVELLDEPLPASPYHHDTRHMPLSEAEKLVRDVKTSARHRAKLALSSVTTELAPATCSGIAIRVLRFLTCCHGCRGSRGLPGHESG